MTVRVCYLSRGSLGASLKSLRLVGHGADDRWPEHGHAPTFEGGAEWVRGRLAGSRSGGSLTLLCLDVEGGVCSWLSAPSGSAAVVAALARSGPSTSSDASGGSRSGTGAVEFYAADSFSSSIQALDVGEGAQGGTATLRLPILAVTDVPGRLLMDALDRVNVGVEAAATLWHVMAHAWDPGAPRPGAAAADPANSPVTGVILVDAESSRLLWTWSRAGQLLVSGSIRLRRSLPDTDAIVEQNSEPASAVAYSAEDVSRLTVEWLSWAAQIGVAPSRFVCVLPDSAQASSLGKALGQSWQGSTVDVVIKPDPVGATLSRAVDVLENTPAGNAENDPGQSLVELSSRPGRTHRQLYTWWSITVAVAAVILVYVGFLLQQSASEATAASAAWRVRQDEAIKAVMPGVAPAPGKSTLDILQGDVDKRQKDLAAVKRNDAPMPILEELETLSFVIGNNGFSLESIDLNNSSPRFTAVSPTTADAEMLVDALRRVAGLHSSDWNGAYTPVKEGENNKVKGVYSGKWIKPEGVPK